MWKKMTFHTTDGNNITVNGNFNTSMTFSAYIETLTIWPLTIPTSVTKTLPTTLLHKTKTMTMPITTRSVEKNDLETTDRNITLSGNFHTSMAFNAYIQKWMTWIIIYWMTIMKSCTDDFGNTLLDETDDEWPISWHDTRQ